MREVVLAVALLTAGLAGCIGGSEEPIQPTKAPERQSPEASNTSTNASADAGSTPTNETASPVPVEQELTWDGSTGTWALGCAGTGGAGACTPPLGVESGDRIHNESFSGDLQQIELTVTWEPESPAMEELQATVRADCSDECTAETEGPSPLTLQLEVPADEQPWFVVVVSPASHTTPVGWVWAGHDQPFHVEGVYTVLEGGAT